MMMMTGALLLNAMTLMGQNFEGLRTSRNVISVNLSSATTDLPA